MPVRFFQRHFVITTAFAAVALSVSPGPRARAAGGGAASVTASDLARVPLTLALADRTPVESAPSARSEDQVVSELRALPENPPTPPSVEVTTGRELSSVPKRFQYSFRLNMRGTYDDNISLQPTNRVSDYYCAIEPGLSLGFGDIVGADMNSIRLDYAPSIFIYDKNSSANAVQHLISLDGRYRFGHLSLGLTQDIQLLEGANPASAANTGFNTGPTINIDTRGNTQVNNYNTRGTFSYDLTGKTFLSGSANFSASDYQQQLISSQQISGNVYLNYIYSPKLTFGLGGTVGYNWVEATNPNQLFEQLNFRLNYQLTGKVSLDGSIGVEWRQYEGSLNGGNNVSPVFELGASYQPFDGTTVSLQGSRRNQNSAVLAGQDYSNTTINLTIRQRFLRRFYLGLAGGYQRSDYFNTVSFISATRSDDYFFIQPSIDATLTRYWTAGVYYLHRKDDSSVETFNFYDNQFGLRTSFSF